MIGRYFIFLLFLYNSCAVALEDSLQKASAIALHGLQLQSMRITVSAENTANVSSVSLKPGGKPYQRKVLYAKNMYDKNLKTNVVKVKKVDVDKQTPFVMKYDPYHPGADEKGYVKYPNVNDYIELADSKEAERSYKANLSVMETSKDMIQRTVEAIR